jgi:hypothetical protein
MKTRRCDANSMAFAELLAGILLVSLASAVAERVQDLPKPTAYVNDFAHGCGDEAQPYSEKPCAPQCHNPRIMLWVIARAAETTTCGAQRIVRRFVGITRRDTLMCFAAVSHSC